MIEFNNIVKRFRRQDVLKGVDFTVERGHRIDESVSGHGIGLSIVKEIADSYQADLELTHSKHGGLKIKLIFKQSPY